MKVSNATDTPAVVAGEAMDSGRMVSEVFPRRAALVVMDNLMA
jgi:hypothetical protein